RLCIRFYRRADGTILTQNCPRGLSVLIRRISRIAAAVLTAAMSAGSSISHAATKKSASAQESQAAAGVDVTVLDPSGAVIQNARAILCRCKDHVTVNVSTDANGVAHFAGLTAGTYMLEVQAQGFKGTRQSVKVQSRKVENFQVKLQIAPATMTIDVKGEPSAIMGIMGVISVTQPPFPYPSVAPRGRPGLMR